MLEIILKGNNLTDVSLTPLLKHSFPSVVLIELDKNNYMTG